MGQLSAVFIVLISSLLFLALIFSAGYVTIQFIKVGGVKGIYGVDAQGKGTKSTFLATLYSPITLLGNLVERVKGLLSVTLGPINTILDTIRAIVDIIKTIISTIL